MKHVAVVGAGVSGLGAAWALSTASKQVRVTLLEADDRLGGHAHTVDVTLPNAQGRPVTHGVDTGFLVFNERTYPRLQALLAELGVVPARSDMSFSVQVPHVHDMPNMPRDGNVASGLDAWMSGLQWCGSSLNTVFAQRRNVWSPRFWGMLRDLLRFNAEATALAQGGDEAALAQPIGQFLDTRGFGVAFRNAYLLPMIACIWSCPTQQMLAFPVGTLIRFCHNHGLLQVRDRPQWYTVQGGSREYVKRMAQSLLQRGVTLRMAAPVSAIERQQAERGGVMLHTPQGWEHFDEVILACHSDQALRMLGKHATMQEHAVLGAVRYHHNRAVLHTDTSLLPAERRAWAAWNYERTAPNMHQPPAVCLHYLINRLQPLPWQRSVVVSLNPLRQPSADTVLAEFDYAHPVFDQAAVDAQQRLGGIQGQQGVWFCGAWTGYGFHEDGLRSGQMAASELLAVAYQSHSEPQTQHAQAEAAARVNL